MGNKIVVGVWDCAYCGADKISGEIQVCPHCGKPRGSDVKFYMAGPKQYVKDPDKVSRNPDWLCSYCDTLNPDENKYCSSCGASRADSELNYFQNKEKKEREEAEEKRRQEMQNNGAREGDGPAGRSKGPGRLPLIAGILLVIGILAFMMMPKNKKMQVDGKTVTPNSTFNNKSGKKLTVFYVSANTVTAAQTTTAAPTTAAPTTTVAVTTQAPVPTTEAPTTPPEPITNPPEPVTNPPEPVEQPAEQPAEGGGA